jgi:hypothetical protein
MIAHIMPQWDMEAYRRLDYTLAYHKDTALNDLYAAAGHDRERMTIYNYFQPNPMPNSMAYILQHFDMLENIAAAVNLFRPGQYLPMHSDLYNRYSRLHDVGGRPIWRAIVMLEDCEPGQILQIGYTAHARWEAGRVFWWRDSDEHAFYNFSRSDRYAVQLTGTRR